MIKSSCLCMLPVSLVMYAPETFTTVLLASSASNPNTEMACVDNSRWVSFSAAKACTPSPACVNIKCLCGKGIVSSSSSNRSIKLPKDPRGACSVTISLSTPSWHRPKNRTRLGCSSSRRTLASAARLLSRTFVACAVNVLPLRKSDTK